MEQILRELQLHFFKQLIDSVLSDHLLICWMVMVFSTGGFVGVMAKNKGLEILSQCKSLLLVE